MAHANYFLKIDGVSGESTDPQHKDWIDVLSWGWGETNSGTFGQGGGGGVGKVQIQDFHFTMYVCRATPRLFMANASGDHFRSAIMEGWLAGAPKSILRVTFADLLVLSFQTGGCRPGEDRPIDLVSLNFTAQRTDYNPQNLKEAVRPQDRGRIQQAKHRAQVAKGK